MKKPEKKNKIDLIEDLIISHINCFQFTDIVSIRRINKEIEYIKKEFNKLK